MAKYQAVLQRTLNGQVRVCVISTANGKLVLPGEAVRRRIDALQVATNLNEAFGYAEGVMDIYPASHRWPKNSGPKKSKPVTKKKK